MMGSVLCLIFLRMKMFLKMLDFFFPFTGQRIVSNPFKGVET